MQALEAGEGATGAQPMNCLEEALRRAAYCVCSRCRVPLWFLDGHYIMFKID